jgi:energy-coupling factor transporter ATP-binding protein EcfA2
VKVPAYNPQSQPRPRLPITCPAFSLIEDDIKQIISVFKSMIKASQYLDDEAKHLFTEIVAHSTIPYEEVVRIGLIGDSGAGKSSLINSILGFPNLTLEVSGCMLMDIGFVLISVQMDLGKACTNVPIEFAKALSTQDQAFLAEVIFYCEEVCLQMVSEWIATLFNAIQGTKPFGEDDDIMETAQADTARDCLRDLFADHAEFKDHISIDNYLATAKSATDPKILSRMKKLTADILHMFVPQGTSALIFEATTPETLKEKYEPFVHLVPHASFHGLPMRFSPWPFVQLVR